MATLQSFEEIEAWQKARELTRAVYACSGAGAFARGSAGEVEAQLYVALDQGYISREKFDSIRALASSTKKLIAGFMNYLKSSDLKGQKYK